MTVAALAACTRTGRPGRALAAPRASAHRGPGPRRSTGSLAGGQLALESTLDDGVDGEVERQFEELDDRHERHSQVEAERAANVAEVRLHLVHTPRHRCINTTRFTISMNL